MPLIFSGYDTFLSNLKASIRQAQIRAGLAVNRELILLYWKIGHSIMEQQKVQGWGAKIIDRLTFAIVQAAPAQITWYHNCTLLDKIKDVDERAWYMAKTVEYGWSRDLLVLQIESKLYQRQGKAVVNFDRTLPAPQSDLARQILKDPYNFDFLTLASEAHERDLEHGLLEHVRLFLLELGVGFAFVGSQYHLNVGGDDFYIDLLFYHLQLRCYVVIELKAKEFESEFAGKMNFYLSAIDDLLRHPEDKPSIGMILCKTKNKVVAEYALRDINKPIGISEYKTTELLPENLKGSLPTIEELEQKLTDIPQPTDGE